MFSEVCQLVAVFLFSTCYVICKQHSSDPVGAVGINFNSTTDLAILDELLRTYDRRELPTTHLGVATIVTCEVDIRSFGSISPETMDYEIDLYLRESWIDERLKKKTLSRNLDLNDPHLIKRIWKPEVFFPNAKMAEFQYVTVPNVLVRVNPSGKILYVLRLKLRFSCMMELSSFPMDLQVCTIELASFSKTTDELRLIWAQRSPITLFGNLKLPQFEIEKVNTSLCRENFHIGEYSCLIAEFYLQRSIGYHLVQSYLPTILIVVVSWVSFWLDIEAIPARITLGVTTLLTISSKGSAIQSNLPPVSYVKAIDVWMGACTMFVFAALMEFTVANFLWRRKCRNKNPQLSAASCSSGYQKRILPMKCGATDQSLSLKNKTSFVTKVYARRVDQLSRLMFPLLFAIFNVAYWVYYLWN
ncbi:glycine receptor subunit alpha-2-like isoform X2 [Limulus polyphemus]|uniref:Glycine receptor subunit alpha-2-like isoform X2 n=1 Tax=Limulus polyphemus TaxID=6850 RepID=A0ABM1S777_LIMPO|nr:glycine receptor subunit alpha-2-like isoform X2 [Limulus polyphemus]